LPVAHTMKLAIRRKRRTDWRQRPQQQSSRRHFGHESTCRKTRESAQPHTRARTRSRNRAPHHSKQARAELLKHTVLTNSYVFRNVVDCVVREGDSALLDPVGKVEFMKGLELFGGFQLGSLAGRKGILPHIVFRETAPDRGLDWAAPTARKRTAIDTSPRDASSKRFLLKFMRFQVLRLSTLLRQGGTVRICSNHDGLLRGAGPKDSHPRPIPIHGRRRPPVEVAWLSRGINVFQSSCRTGSER
jgi:hypothetical protein